MCQPSPGPRCSSHLKPLLKAANKKLKKLDSSTPGDVEAYITTRAEKESLQFDYDGTRTGQKELTNRINALTAEKGDPDEIMRLSITQVRARNAYKEKKEALATTAKEPSKSIVPDKERSEVTITRATNSDVAGRWNNINYSKLPKYVHESVEEASLNTDAFAMQDVKTTKGKRDRSNVLYEGKSIGSVVSAEGENGTRWASVQLSGSRAVKDILASGHKSKGLAVSGLIRNFADKEIQKQRPPAPVSSSSYSGKGKGSRQDPNNPNNYYRALRTPVTATAVSSSSYGGKRGRSGKW